MRRIIALIIFASSLLSCQKELPYTSLVVDEMTFSVDSVSTKGSVINSGNILSMMLFCHTAPSKFDGTSNANYMYKAESQFVAGNKWVTQSPSGDAISNTIWDGDNYHSFFAFAPYDIINHGTFSAQTTTGPPAFLYTVPDSPIDHKDLLCSSHIDAIHYYLTNKPVSLTFDHTLSKITFSANKGNYDAAYTTPDEVVIKSLLFSNIWNTATLNFKESPAGSGKYIGDWDYSTSGAKDNSMITSIINGGLKSHVLDNAMTNLTTLDGTLMSLPQSFIGNDDAVMTVVMDITKTVNGATTTNEYIKQFNLKTISSSGWSMGKSYHYKFTYNGDGVLPSSVEVTMTDWDEEVVDGDVSGTYLDVANIEYETDNSVKIYYSTNDPESIAWSDNNNGTITKAVGSDYLLYTPSSIGIDNVKITVGKLSRVVSIKSLGTDPSTVTPAPFAGNTYIGAFWKAMETQERLIDMNQEGVANWSAKVIWIDDRWNIDDIVLDTNYPASLPIATSPVDVASTLSSVSGTGTIKFRIGLNSIYTPTEEFPVRYAIVLVEADANKQFIYLRQGENPDYLMRKGDKNGSGASIVNDRAYARKISAYNLTAKAIKEDTAKGGSLATDNTQHPQLPSGESGEFVNYPTQGGAYWQHMLPSTGNLNANYARRAYHPTNLVGSLTSWLGGINTTEFWRDLQVGQKVSPENYVINDLSYNFGRINDGTISGYNRNGLISSSELRQSLWLNPISGSGNTNSDNLVSGYYADGFFDRNIIVASNTGAVKSTVLADTGNVAYAGRLFFNPITYASLFLPSCGYRTLDNGRLLLTGSAGGYWTSSARDAVNGWCFFSYTASVTSTPAGVYIASRSYGFAVRPIVSE